MPLGPSSINLRILPVGALCLSIHMAFIMAFIPMGMVTVAQHMCDAVMVTRYGAGCISCSILAWHVQHLLPEMHVLVPESWPHLAFKRLTLFWNGPPLSRQNKKLLSSE